LGTVLGVNLRKLARELELRKFTPRTVPRFISRVQASRFVMRVCV
jgi:hypothetical protein